MLIQVAALALIVSTMIQSRPMIVGSLLALGGAVWFT